MLAGYLGGGIGRLSIWAYRSLVSSIVARHGTFVGMAITYDYVVLYGY